MTVTVERQGPVTVITINRPERCNAVDRATAELLFNAFTDFATDDLARVAVLTGAGGNFCAGADLHAIAAGKPNEVTDPEDIIGTVAPMGPSRLVLPKPVIAAVEGYAVAGGLELAVWCDLRVAGESATFGVFCRQVGVPLIDGGTVRLPRLIGASRASDLILTGRPVRAQEALEIGLVNRLAPTGEALAAALELATQLAQSPQHCLREDLRSTREQWGYPLGAALTQEVRGGIAVLESGEPEVGAARFSSD